MRVFLGALMLFSSAVVATAQTSDQLEQHWNCVHSRPERPIVCHPGPAPHFLPNCMAEGPLLPMTDTCDQSEQSFKAALPKHLSANSVVHCAAQAVANAN